MRVYHFCPRIYALQNLQKSRLKVATFDDLNDPFELLSARLRTPSHRQAFKSFKVDARESMGILCFGKSWDNPVMWSHYADRHRGICLGFDVPDEYAIDVNYVEGRPDIKYSDELLKQGVDEQFALNLMRTKYSGWGYEQEVRMFVGLDETVREESGLHFFSFGSNLELREVILGPSFRESTHEVTELVAATYARVRVARSRLAFNTFRVVQDKRFA